MPYVNISEAERNNPGIRGLPAKAKRAWVVVFNSAKNRGLSDAAAARMAWAVAQRIKGGIMKIDVRGDTLAIGIPFEKIDAERRTVEGFATLDNIDSAGEIVDFEASREAFKNWIGNIREMHGPKAVGKALEFQEKEKETDGQVYHGIYVKAYISKGAQDTWEKILDGTLKGFSLGGRVLEKRPEIIKSDGPFSRRQIIRITKYSLGELSVVDNPANPLALFDNIRKSVLVKSDEEGLEATDVLANDIDVPEKTLFFCEPCDLVLIYPEDKDACDVCGETMISLGSAFEFDDADIEKAVHAHKEAKEKHRAGSSHDPLWQAIVMHAEHLEDPKTATHESQVEMMRLLLLAYAKELEVTLEFEEADTEKAVLAYKDAMEKLREERAEIEPLDKREFPAEERRRLAERGLAMPDGSFPIVTVEDLRNAIQAFGRAKDKEAVKRWIIRRAKELGRTDLLPDKWRVINNMDIDLQNSETNETISKQMDKTDNNEVSKEVEMSKGDIDSILDVIKSSLNDLLQQVLAKVGVQELNDEDATDVSVSDQVATPPSVPADNAEPGKVDGTVATTGTWAAPPGSDNVVPHAFGKDESVEFIKSVIAEEISKLTSKLEEAFNNVQSKFEELSERLEKVENSGAEKKSGEVNTELRKSRDDSFWGGKFLSRDFM